MSKMTGPVTVIPWGNIDNPDEPRRWGLKVGEAYVSRGRKALLFDTRGEAVAEGKKLRARLSSQSDLTAAVGLPG